MTSDTFQLIFTFLVLGAVFACLVKEWVSSELAALSGMSLLILAGILVEDDIKLVFSNAAPITIGAMFILSESLVRTGAIDVLAAKFTQWAGKSIHRALVVIALIVMPLSAFLNNTQSEHAPYSAVLSQYSRWHDDSVGDVHQSTRCRCR